MLSTKTAALALVALVATGGAVATASTETLDGNSALTAAGNAPTDVDVDAHYENDTVDVTVTDDDEPLENVSVVANGDASATTDANGTVAFDAVNLTDENETFEELELELSADGFEGELTYAVENGSLVLQEEHYEYGADDERAAGHDDDHPNPPAWAENENAPVFDDDETDERPPGLQTQADDGEDDRTVETENDGEADENADDGPENADDRAQNGNADR
ncbi:hypothetical protein VB779_18065 [Haloarculaceae archaeon H-GB11]|nr:hypothetical protein [Haloarculaceae archaeon H-GB11]